MLVLNHLSARREPRSCDQSNNLENAHYPWCVEKPTYPIEAIHKVVHHWIFNVPISYLNRCTYADTLNLWIQEELTLLKLSYTQTIKQITNHKL